MNTLCRWQSIIGYWVEKTVPTSNHLKKLQEEVEELVNSPKDPEEMADVFIALLAHAHKYNINIELAVSNKFDKMQTRVYSEPDDNSVSHHV